MKIIAAALLLLHLPSSAVGFVSPSCNSPTTKTTFGVRQFMSATVESSEAASSEPAIPSAGLEMVESSGSSSDNKDDYTKIGFTEDTIAMGLDPEEIMEFIGTRDDIVTKFKTDMPNFSSERIEEEVAKFMMDYEMVSRWITYNKKKKYEAAKPVIAAPTPSSASSTPAEPSLAEQLGDPSVWATYAAWIGGGAGFAIFKNQIAEPRFASGEWSDIHLNVGDWLTQFGGAGADVVTPVVGQADNILSNSVPVDAVQSTVEAVAGTVTDALN